MKRDKKSLVSYTAGYFDGEGYIHGRKRGSKGNYNISLEIDCRYGKDSLNLMCSLYGGYVGIRYSNRDEKCFYHWHLLDAQKVKRSLKLMYPFLREKKVQAEIGMRLCDRIIVGKRKRIWGRGNALSDHELEKRSGLALILRNLKWKLPKELIEQEQTRAETKRVDTSKEVNR